MKSKFALALDLLEQEVEVLSKEQQTQFIGGDDYGSGGYDSGGYDSNGSNGYCYFNNLAYVANTMGCSTKDFNDYYDDYTTVYDADEDILPSTTGDGIGGVANNTHANDFLKSQFNTTTLNSSASLNTYLIQHPDKIVTSSYGTGEWSNGVEISHDVVLKSHGLDDGGHAVYNVYDTTSKTNYSVSESKVHLNATFGIESCK